MAKVPTGERTAELLLLAQAAGSDGVDLTEVREQWGGSPATMRRVVRQLLATVDRLGLKHLGQCGEATSTVIPVGRDDPGDRP